jgi:hypothetical protein
MSNANESSQPKTPKPSYQLEFARLFFFTYTVILLLMVTAYGLTFGYSFSDKHEYWGQFGDFIGGILNPLTSFFTLLVAIAVWKLQQQELVETREALIEQAVIAERQRREQRFFDLMDLYKSTVNSIEIHDLFSKPKGTGKLAIDTSANEIIRNHREYFSDSSLEKIDEKFVESSNFWSLYSNQLTTYFRVVATLLRELELTLGSENYRYAKVFRSQLTVGEVRMLSLAALLNPEAIPTRPLLVKYGLLKNLSHEDKKLRSAIIETIGLGALGRSYADS